MYCKCGFCHRNLISYGRLLDHLNEFHSDEYEEIAKKIYKEEFEELIIERHYTRYPYYYRQLYHWPEESLNFYKK